MSDLNRVTVQGRIVRNAEFTTTESGLKVGRFTIATNRYKRNPDGSHGEESYFFPLAVFGKYAENLEQYLVKGQQVIVDGYIRQHRWEKDGEKKSEIGIGVERIHLIFSGKKSEEERPEMVTNFQREETFQDSALDFPPSEAEEGFMIF